MGMKYRVFITDEARAQLRALPKEQRRNIGYRLDMLETDLSGDVKKLSGKEAKYRLRVGAFRVLFALEIDSLVVYSVKNRKEAYE